MKTYTTEEIRAMLEARTKLEQCYECGGRGYYFEDNRKCSHCNGEGIFKSTNFAVTAHYPDIIRQLLSERDALAEKVKEMERKLRKVEGKLMISQTDF